MNTAKLFPDHVRTKADRARFSRAILGDLASPSRFFFQVRAKSVVMTNGAWIREVDHVDFVFFVEAAFKIKLTTLEEGDAVRMLVDSNGLATFSGVTAFAVVDNVLATRFLDLWERQVPEIVEKGVVMELETEIAVRSQGRRPEDATKFFELFFNETSHVAAIDPRFTPILTQCEKVVSIDGRLLVGLDKFDNVAACVACVILRNDAPFRRALVTGGDNGKS